MKVYRQHRCTSQHRSCRTFIECAIRRAAWVLGDGEYALIAWCRVPTITLWQHPAEAEQSMRLIDSTGCGGRCTGRHEIVRIDLGEVTHGTR